MEDVNLNTKIDVAEKAIANAEAGIEKAKLAGIDTSELEAGLEASKASLSKLKEVYL